MSYHRVSLLGISELDDDHLALGHIIAELELSGEDDAKAAEVGVIAKRLVDAAKLHFEREEAMMEQAQYPLAERHREAHGELIEWIEGLTGRLASGEVTPDKDVIAALWGWETAHIDSSDRMYAVYAMEKKIGIGVLKSGDRELD